MFGIMGIDSAFMNAAGQVGKGQNKLSFVSGDADLAIFRLSCEGEIVIRTVKGGEAHTETYSNLADAAISLSCDANTLVTITGNVTTLVFYNSVVDPEEPVNISDLNVSKCKSLAILSIAWCQNLTSIDLSANTELAAFDCSYCTGLTTLDLSANTALIDLFVHYCTGLASLDLTANTLLEHLICLSCTGLTTIKYPGTNEDVSTAIADAITNATAADGTVYTDSAAAYYSTIATAATTKGWTIEQL